jgi:integrase
MESKVKVLYVLNKSKRSSRGLVPIYLRVTHKTLRFHKSTGFHIKDEDWDVKNQRIKGSTMEIHAKNSQLDTMKVKVLQVVNQLILNDKPFNVQTIKKMIEGNDASQVTLMRVCDEHIKEMQKLKGKDYEQATIIKYKNTVLRLRQFLKYKYKRIDIFLYELNFHFISEFESFLKYKYDNSTTTCYKHYQRFTRMIRRAISKGYLEKYPFGDYKIRMPKKKIQYLTQAELNRIELQDFKAERLNIIRDIFVFCCYTGLAYAELESLTPDNITTGMDGELWLNIHRKKTNKDYQVPLLPKALEILEKYKNHPKCIKKGCCVPVPSNQKYNAYLKEIGDMAEIPQDKPLVSHLARKTFACTVGLANGMNIGVLSKLLGHSSIQITLDSYATVIDELMINNVRALKEKLSIQEKREDDGVASNEM